MCIRDRRKDVLLVPNTALRFTPSQRGTASNAASSGGGIVSKLMPRPPGGGKTAGSTSTAAQARQVWVLRDGCLLYTSPSPREP